MKNFRGDLELKRLDLTWSGQVDLMAATLRSSMEDCSNDMSTVHHHKLNRHSRLNDVTRNDTMQLPWE